MPPPPLEGRGNGPQGGGRGGMALAGNLAFKGSLGGTNGNSTWAPRARGQWARSSASQWTSGFGAGGEGASGPYGFSSYPSDQQGSGGRLLGGATSLGGDLLPKGPSAHHQQSQRPAGRPTRAEEADHQGRGDHPRRPKEQHRGGGFRSYLGGGSSPRQPQQQDTAGASSSLRESYGDALNVLLRVTPEPYNGEQQHRGAAGAGLCGNDGIMRAERESRRAERDQRQRADMDGRDLGGGERGGHLGFGRGPRELGSLEGSGPLEGRFGGLPGRRENFGANHHPRNGSAPGNTTSSSTGVPPGGEPWRRRSREGSRSQASASPEPEWGPGRRTTTGPSSLSSTMSLSTGQQYHQSPSQHQTATTSSGGGGSANNLLGTAAPGAGALRGRGTAAVSSSSESLGERRNLGLGPWAPGHQGAAAVAVSVHEEANRYFRPSMEDGYKILDPWRGRPGGDASSSSCLGFYAVYDGHGGRQATDYCLAKMHDVLLGELGHGEKTCGDFEWAFEQAFVKVDDQLRLVGAWNCGCTATIAVLQRQKGNGNGTRTSTSTSASPGGEKGMLYVANVGDSRAVLCGFSEGDLRDPSSRNSAAPPFLVRRASVDHKASDPEENRRILREGGIISRGRVGGQLILSRALGDHALKTSGVSCIPFVFSHELAGWEKALIIASDGVWDVFTDEEASDLVLKFLQDTLRDAQHPQRSGDPREVKGHVEQRAAMLLVDQSLQRGSADNITAVVVFL